MSKEPYIKAEQYFKLSAIEFQIMIFKKFFSYIFEYLNK